MALRSWETKLVQLTREVDVFIARELATLMAENAGFDSYQSADIETAVSEICSNALRYGIRGWAALTLSPDGFEASITDEGPGFEAPSAARTGLGVGLQGAGRLMDELTIEELASGSRVTIKKARRAADPSMEASAYWELSVVNRLKKGNSTSGDTWWCRQDADTVTVAVVDGLGSGAQAEAASSAVVAALEECAPRDPLDRILEYAHEASRTSRGAVGILTRVHGSSIEYCGVGDVSGRVEPDGHTLIVSPGIVGVDIGEPQLRRHPWSEESALALWTDGIEVPTTEVTSIASGPLSRDTLVDLALSQGTDRDDGLFLLARRQQGSGR